MQKTKLGQRGPEASVIGLGCMGMSDFYGPADESESIATVHNALDSGVTLLDTGDFYGMGANELLLRKALQGRKREDFLLSVKFGAMRDPSNAMIGVDCRPNSVKNFLTYSLKRLGTDYIDIYRPARVDPSVPIEETRIAGFPRIEEATDRTSSWFLPPRPFPWTVTVVSPPAITAAGGATGTWFSRMPIQIPAKILPTSLASP